MKGTSESPKWLSVLAYASVIGAVGGFISSFIYAKIHGSWDASSPPLIYVRLLCGAVTSLGIALSTGLIFAVFRGSIYSGTARRKVTSAHDPIHFWLLIGLLGLIILAVISFGLYKFIMA